MMRTSLLTFLVLPFIAGTAHAQPHTWPAETQLRPTAVGRECLDYPMMCEVSVEGDTIAINTPQQKTQPGPITADGGVHAR